MEGINFGTVMNVILAGLGLAFVMGAVGMALWYIKVKPDVDSIKNDLAKKAAAAEVVRINLELDQKKEESHRIKEEIGKKQNINNCDLLRKTCQPLLLEQLKGLSFKIDEVRDVQRVFSSKIDKLMAKNGITL